MKGGFGDFLCSVDTDSLVEIDGQRMIGSLENYVGAVAPFAWMHLCLQRVGCWVVRQIAKPPEYSSPVSGSSYVSTKRSKLFLLRDPDAPHEWISNLKNRDLKADPDEKMLSVFVLITTQVGAELPGILNGFGLFEARVGRARAYARRPFMNFAAG
jgi:hypothetical protein